MPFYLFKTHTTGLLRPKKSLPFESFEEAKAAGQALNIIDKTPDRVFVIISAEHIHTMTNITEELPFNPSFFRLPRLSDSISKFKTASADTDVGFDLDASIVNNPSNPMNGLLINEMHPGISREQVTGLRVFEAFEKFGLTRQNIGALQQSLQFKSGVTALDSPNFPEKFKLLELCATIFPDMKAANSYISQHVMTRMQNFGQYVSDTVPITDDFFHKLDTR